MRPPGIRFAVARRGPPVTSGGAQRRLAIVRFARQFGRLDVSDLADRLGVALETVRRDLTELERSGMIRRSHGAVYPLDHGGFESTLDLRAHQLIAEKRRIADAAYTMLGDAETIYLDEGFTCLLIAEHLVHIQRPITVVTPSLPAAISLAPQRRVSVVMLGGAVRRPTMGMIGPWANEMVLAMVIDIALLGATGISTDRGLTTPNPAVSDLKATAVGQAARKIFVGDHTKFGVESFSSFAKVADFDVLVTDRGLNRHEGQRYASLGPTVDRV